MSIYAVIVIYDYICLFKFPFPYASLVSLQALYMCTFPARGLLILYCKDASSTLFAVSCMLCVKTLNHA